MVDDPLASSPINQSDPFCGTIPADLPHTKQSEVFEESIPPTVEDLKEASSVSIVSSLTHIMPGRTEARPAALKAREKLNCFQRVFLILRTVKI